MSSIPVYLNPQGPTGAQGAPEELLPIVDSGASTRSLSPSVWSGRGPGPYSLGVFQFCNVDCPVLPLIIRMNL